MFKLDEILELQELHPHTLSVKNEIDAFKYCRKVALGHYENFPVGSIFLPKKVRKHIFSIYSFSRIADDIADESYQLSPEERINLLDKFLSNLKNVVKNEISTSNPIFLSLSKTITEKKLPFEPFKKLITAFKMDVYFTEPKNTNDLMEYCSYSANPVGELILRLFNEYNEENAKKSDSITSALQLINFWQDLSIDIKNGRRYIPEGLKLIELFDFTDKLLNFGKNLPNSIKNSRLRFELKLIINAGLKINENNKKMHQLLFEKRPVLRKIDYIWIIYNSLAWKY